MAASAILTLISIDSRHGSSVESIDTAFVAVYSLLFSVLLFIYEVPKFGMCSDEVHDLFSKYFSSNFGFLYSPTSRGVFLIFIALLQFSLEANPGAECIDKNDSQPSCETNNENWLGILTGTLLVFEGILVMVLQCVKPDVLQEPKTNPSRPSPSTNEGEWAQQDIELSSPVPGN